MAASLLTFQALPSEYQQIIDFAQTKLAITITPLQEIVGGWSGAVIYLVRVDSHENGSVAHCILKVDRKRPLSTSDEITRHKDVMTKSPEDFVQAHVPEMVFERVENDNALAIFYAIAGQSLHHFRPLSKHKRQDQLGSLFQKTNEVLLSQWNADKTFLAIEHPRGFFQKWLGFRLNQGQKIEAFIRENCGLDPDTHGFIIRGQIFPNPLFYARHAEEWPGIRTLDAVIGRQHGDLNTNNILASFAQDSNTLDGYFLIDFALYKENMPLFYDQRYLEMSYLVQAIEQTTIRSVIDLMVLFAEKDVLEAAQSPIELVGVSTAVMAGRTAFSEWLQSHHPTMQDDLWGQYWLAGAAAGLSYCHKAGQPEEIRLAGLVYAAANLKRFFLRFGLPMPAKADQLFDEHQFGRRIAAQSAGGKLHNFPIPPTNFIGRESEIQAIETLITTPAVQLVTMTGTGGTGKTRLSLAVSEAAAPKFRDGAYFIDLSAVQDPNLVLATAAHALGIQEGGGIPLLETMKKFLSAKQTLLVFDNFEQVTGAAAMVGDLLSAGIGVRCLVTSRIPLNLRGEHEFPVSPLGLPEEEDEGQDILGTEAIRLFMQQAQAVRPGFEISDENRDAVIEICRRLDGLPLGIEIAAARIKMLPPKALLKRLDQSLKVLVDRSADRPERHRTLRQTIDWSFNLLTHEEQKLFTRLAVFEGGFRLEAAEAICDPENETDVFGGIEILLNNSLLRQVGSVDDEPRFDVLQTVREYAQDRLAESGELDSLRWAHLGYFAGLVEDVATDGVYGGDSVMWLERIEEDHQNYRAALSWGMQHEEGMLAANNILLLVMWFWYRYGYLQEGRLWAERNFKIAAMAGESPIHVMALIGRSYLALWVGDLYVSAENGLEAIKMSQRINFDQGMAYARLSYGTTLINQGRDKEAYAHLVEAVELFDHLDQTWMKGTTLVHLANVSLGMGAIDQALSWLDSAMPYMKETGDLWSMAFALSNYGEVARTRGDYETAEKYYLRTENLYEQSKARGDQARLLTVLGYVAMHKGELERAQEYFQESLVQFRELGSHRGIAECFAGLAALGAMQGRYEWAAPLLSAGETQLRAFGGEWWPADRVEIDRTLEQLKLKLPEAFENLWQMGSSMNVDEAVAYARGMRGAD